MEGESGIGDLELGIGVGRAAWLVWTSPGPALKRGFYSWQERAVLPTPAARAQGCAPATPPCEEGSRYWCFSLPLSPCLRRAHILYL